MINIEKVLEEIGVSIDLSIYEEIRYYSRQGEKGKKAVAKMLGVSINTVRKYWDGDNVPWERKEGSGKTSPVVTEDVIQFIKNCLESDKNAPRKQRHTARRIYDRLVNEMNFSGGESTIRNIVADIKKSNPKAFIPLSFDPGEAMQVDWGEATVSIGGTKQKINIWCMRECHSSAVYVEAFYRQNEESFLEGMRNGFEYFEGVPQKVIFDNARVAVAEGFGKNAKETERYRQMSAHYVFKPTFCNVAEGHEKGLVENLVGLCRRNVLVPPPEVDSVEELNKILLKYCDDYKLHKIRDKPDTVGVMFEESKHRFASLPPYRYDTAKIQSVKVNNFSLAKVDYNKYSVPFQYAGKSITVKSYGCKIEFLASNKIIASYERDFGRNSVHYRLEHYLELIQRNPRSVYNAAPVKVCIPENLNTYLMKLDDPKDVIAILKKYVYDKDSVMYAVENGTPPQQIINDNEIKESSSLIETKITVSVNKPDLSCYDKLIRSCL